MVDAGAPRRGDAQDDCKLDTRRICLRRHGGRPEKSLPGVEFQVSARKKADGIQLAVCGCRGADRSDVSVAVAPLVSPHFVIRLVLVMDEIGTGPGACHCAPTTTGFRLASSIRLLLRILIRADFPSSERVARGERKLGAQVRRSLS